MRTVDAAKVLRVEQRTITRLRDRAGLAAPIGSGSAYRWSPGDVVAMFIVKELDGPDRQGSGGMESQWAEGARKVGEAVDSGFPPAFLLTRGGSENVVVLESEHPDATDEMLAELLTQASDAGAVIRVVPLRRFLRRLAPWMHELVDA